MRALRTFAAAALAAVCAVACGTSPAGSGPATVRPGQPGEASRVEPAERPSGALRPPHTAADVRFMQDMIAHHAQAVVMAALVPARTGSEDIRRLARRIDVSQNDEMALMRRWLEARGETVPDASAHRHEGAGGRQAPVPGMLTDEELFRLAAATGPDFERLFLEFMIRHHEGALVMVAELFARGAGQEPEIFQFASHVDSDQRAEIARMRGLLAAGR